MDINMVKYITKPYALLDDNFTIVGYANGFMSIFSDKPMNTLWDIYAYFAINTTQDEIDKETKKQSIIAKDVVRDNKRYIITIMSVKMEVTRLVIIKEEKFDRLARVSDSIHEIKNRLSFLIHKLDEGQENEHRVEMIKSCRSINDCVDKISSEVKGSLIE